VGTLGALYQSHVGAGPHTRFTRTHDASVVNEIIDFIQLLCKMAHSCANGCHVGQIDEEELHLVTLGCLLNVLQRCSALYGASEKASVTQCAICYISYGLATLSPSSLSLVPELGCDCQ
jgi:hypothetical protein